MKKLLTTLLAFGLAFFAFAGNSRKPDEEISIVYTNDIHSYISNSFTDKETKETRPGLRISDISQLVKDMKAEGKNVLLVDSGDEIQGNSYGSIDNGKSIIELMNKAGYDLATPGNHDFDYGSDNFFEMTRLAKFPYISCNFRSISPLTKKNHLDAVKILKTGGKKIGFIGITTPETFTSSTPKYFQDENGNYVYAIDGTENPEDLYASVQKAIDMLKGKADYIIALGHVGLGLSEIQNKISSLDVIRNTAGLDVFIDGHSHTTVEADHVEDKTGKKVLLTQSGAYLKAFGIVTISPDGTITSKLYESTKGENPEVAALENKLIEKVNAQLGKKIAEMDTELYVDHPDRPDHRYIRAMELNLGDFVPDSIYWYFNEAKGLNCDIALQNAGGIRTNIKKGDVTYLDVKNVCPFGNMVCLIKATGQEIKDALEMGTTAIGIWDDKWDTPLENGGFMQVAGLRYTIDPNIPSSVVLDDKGCFKEVKGAYRVKDIEVYNKQEGAYEAIDLSKTYTVGGVNYILRNNGNGLSMFAGCQTIVDFAGQDCDILTSYFKAFSKNGGFAEIKNAGSPLKDYSGYLLDYENPFGAGRIKIEELKAK